MILKSVSCPEALYKIECKQLGDTSDRLHTVEISYEPIYEVKLWGDHGDLLFPVSGELVSDPEAEYVTIIKFRYYSDCMEPYESSWAIFQPHATCRHYNDKKSSTMPNCLLAPTVFHVSGRSITSWSGSLTYNSLDIYRESKQYSDKILDILECI